MEGKNQKREDYRGQIRNMSFLSADNLEIFELISLLLTLYMWPIICNGPYKIQLALVLPVINFLTTTKNSNLPGILGNI